MVKSLFWDLFHKTSPAAILFIITSVNNNNNNHNHILCICLISNIAIKTSMTFALRLTGILKFHEVYLGEGASEGGTSDFQEGGGGVMPSSLEQHISNAREALGVDSYYSR